MTLTFRRRSSRSRREGLPDFTRFPFSFARCVPTANSLNPRADWRPSCQLLGRPLCIQRIGPRRTEVIHQRRHRFQRRQVRCRTHCSATEAPRGSTREGWNDRPSRLHPLHMGRHRVQHRCCPSGSGCASEPGKPGDPVGFLLKRTATKSARRVAREMDFDWSGLLPWAVLKASQDPKLTRFVEDRSRQTP